MKDEQILLNEMELKKEIRENPDIITELRECGVKLK